MPPGAIQCAIQTEVIAPAENEETGCEFAEESVDVTTLLGPANVPPPLHDAPRTDAGETDWVKLAAIVRAVECLVGAGLVGHAKPLVSELRSMIEGAMRELI